MVEAAQRLQAASHAAVVLYDGLKGLSENKGNSGAGYVVTSALLFRGPGFKSGNRCMPAMGEAT